MMGLKIDFERSNLNKNLQSVSTKLGAFVLMYASAKASELQSKMQVNRPWTDRTGTAKATMKARVSRPEENIIRITLAYGVDYGTWLELANEKNYAIIAPTVREEGPHIVEDLNGLMEKLKI